MTKGDNRYLPEVGDLIRYRRQEFIEGLHLVLSTPEKARNSAYAMYVGGVPVHMDSWVVSVWELTGMCESGASFQKINSPDPNWEIVLKFKPSHTSHQTQVQGASIPECPDCSGSTPDRL